MHHIQTVAIHTLTFVRTRLEQLADEAGEGVISTAIAVLVMSFVGAAMWLGFKALADSTCDTIAAQLLSVFRNGSDINCG